jgi:hypothetical protein
VQAAVKEMLEYTQALEALKKIPPGQRKGVIPFLKGVTTGLKWVIEQVHTIDSSDLGQIFKVFFDDR